MATRPITVLQDGTILDATAPMADPSVNEHNAKCNLADQQGKLLGRLMYDDTLKQLVVQQGTWVVDPADKREVPPDQKRRVWQPKEIR